MNKDLHNTDGHQDDFFSISADQGWQNMASLLDAEMPVKKRRLPWAGILRFTMAACLLFAVLKTSDNLLLQTNTTDKNGVAATETVTGETGAGDGSVASAQSSSSLSRPSLLVNNNPTNSTPVLYSHASTQNTQTGNKPPTGHTVFSSAYKNDDFAVAANTGTNDETNKTGFLDGPEAGNGNQQAAKDDNVLATPGNAQKTVVVKDTDALANNTAAKDKPADKKKKTSLFALYAGAQLQQGLQSGNSFTASPYAQVQYNLGKKWFASVGVGAFTGNGGAKAIEIEEKEINDFTNNIKTYATITSHTKMRYVDVPVEIGFKINKHLSVQAGVQTSFLVKKRQEVTYEISDFRMTSNASITPPATLGVPYPQPAAEPRKTDFRYLAGVRYDVGRFTAKLQYQQGTKPIMAVASENEVRSTKAQTVNLQLLYRLWK